MEFNYDFFDGVIQRKELANTKKVQIQKACLSIKTLKCRRWNKREDFMNVRKLKQTEKCSIIGAAFEWIVALTLSYSQGCRAAGKR